MKLHQLLREFEDQDYLKLKAHIESVFDIESIHWNQMTLDDSHWIFTTGGNDKNIEMSVTPNVNDSKDEFGITLQLGESPWESADEVNLHDLIDDEDESAAIRQKMKDHNVEEFKSFFDKSIKLRDILKADGKIVYVGSNIETETVNHDIDVISLEIIRTFKSLMKRVTITIVWKAK